MSAEPESIVHDMLLGHLATGHRTLGELLRQLNHEFVELQQQPDCMPKIKAALQHLRDDLAQHFRQEEAGGFMEEAVARRPQLGSAADQLLKEHPEILRETERLLKQCEQCPETNMSCQALQQQFQKLADQIHNHEDRENRLIQSGYNVDYNGLLK